MPLGFPLPVAPGGAPSLKAGAGAPDAGEGQGEGVPPPVNPG
jgi:hypothetical protein